VGRVAPVKGTHVLVRALPGILESFQVKLRLIGPLSEPYHTELRHLARDLGVLADVEFVGPIPFGPQLWAAYAAATLYVQPSMSEGTPKTLVEAMGAGLPIVASRVGGIPELIADGWNGFLVDPGNPITLGIAIISLLEASELRASMGRHSAIRAQAFTLEVQLQRLLEFLYRRWPQLQLKAVGDFAEVKRPTTRP
jgi:glycosyltransferase involved in cell wall biosynthesis